MWVESSNISNLEFGCIYGSSLFRPLLLRNESWIKMCREHGCESFWHISEVHQRRPRMKTNCSPMNPNRRVFGNDKAIYQPKVMSLTLNSRYKRRLICDIAGTGNLLLLIYWYRCNCEDAGIGNVQSVFLLILMLLWGQWLRVFCARLVSGSCSSAAHKCHPPLCHGYFGELFRSEIFSWAIGTCVT